MSPRDRKVVDLLKRIENLAAEQMMIADREGEMRKAADKFIVEHAQQAQRLVELSS